ncbi:hypothetical protein H9P43_006222 [Blastocladiella emersonii ATCC 22665]|nr:hypothetical protein H9P43_006222 [Blastocladiella emersonii ATCC 22665]
MLPAARAPSSSSSSSSASTSKKDPAPASKPAASVEQGPALLVIPKLTKPPPSPPNNRGKRSSRRAHPHPRDAMDTTRATTEQPASSPSAVHDHHHHHHHRPGRPHRSLTGSQLAADAEAAAAAAAAAARAPTEEAAAAPSSGPKFAVGVDDDGRPADEISDDTAVPADLANLADTKGLGRFRQDPVRFMIRLSAEGSAFYLGSGWRKYEGYIGSKILYPGYSKDIYRAVLASTTVQDAIAATVAHEVRQGRDRATIEKAARAKATSYINALIADLSSKRTLRFVAFVVNNLLVRMYHQGIFIKGSEWLALRNAAKAAEEKGVSLVFLPCHKSHVDYLVISYVFYRLGLALPHIAAGQNLNIPVVGKLLKKGGAFFIRRSFGNDPMYSAVFKSYLEVLLQRGHNMEAFIEGTRSRTGKLLPPRFGVLKVILDAVMSGRVKDAVIVPMSIGYDKVIETESYVNELLGRPKEPESLGQLVNSTSVLQLKLGRIDVRFATPWSLRAWVDAECMARVPGPLAHGGVNSQLLLRALGYRVLSDINGVSVIMPSALVGTVILTLRGRGVGRSDLVAKIDWLRSQIVAKGGKVAEFGDPTPVILDRVLALLGADLIGERRELLEPVYFVKKRFELSLYRNAVMHHFIAEAILCASIEVGLREQRGGVAMTYHQLLRDVAWLSQIFKREFIYPPGGVLDNMNVTLKSLKRNEVLGDIDQILDREKFDFYCFLIWPFVETYWLACVSLLLLDPTRSWGDDGDGEGAAAAADGSVPLRSTASDDPVVAPRRPTWFLESAFTNQVQELAKVLYYEGELTYFESINKEILKNAWNSFQEAGIIVYQSNPGSDAPPATTTPATSPASPPPPSASASTTAAAPTGLGGTHIALARDWHPAKNDRLVHTLATLHRFRRDKDGVMRYYARAGLSPRVRRLLDAALAKMGAGYLGRPEDAGWLGGKTGGAPAEEPPLVVATPAGAMPEPKL